MDVTKTLWLNVAKCFTYGAWLKFGYKNFTSSVIRDVSKMAPETELALSGVAGNLLLTIGSIGVFSALWGDAAEKRHASTAFFVGNVLSIYSLFTARNSLLTQKSFSIGVATEVVLGALNLIYGILVKDEGDEEYDV
eukprot:TRINITY_DN6236_c0_g1_i1.p1 TRINITY_DN6236_c0_g1~~TRINITY_DN6236_c0_g1_i1.p1  ORF type:complete len:137 (+),score=22.01 TRINITY_DN6236_c0_g1_i1:93-503(+)